MELWDFHKDGLTVLQGMEGTNFYRIVSGDSRIPYGIFRRTIGFAVQVVPLDSLSSEKAPEEVLSKIEKFLMLF